MLEQKFDLIIGLHSIQAAIKNPKRKIHNLFATNESIKELRDLPEESKIKILGGHEVQEKAKELSRELGYQLNRAPSNMCLVCDALKVEEAKFIDKSFSKILCLDSVSDIHNAAAIMRTAEFFGIDAVVIPQKKTFGLTPGFYRMASGAVESLPIIRVAQLSKLIRNLKEDGWECVGLSEHSKKEFSKPIDKKTVLIVGAEDIGLSHVVLRECDQVMSLKSQGQIQSLNVSVAAAIALEKCFG